MQPALIVEFDEVQFVLLVSPDLWRHMLAPIRATHSDTRLVIAIDARAIRARSRATRNGDR
jgi:hypothetical protein